MTQLQTAVDFGQTSTESMKVSILIPVYNERAYIEEVLLRVQAAPLEKEVVVIDDGSTDGTRALLEEFAKAQVAGSRDVAVQNGKAQLSLENIHFLFQDRNCGKGAALRRPLDVSARGCGFRRRGSWPRDGGGRRPGRRSRRASEPTRPAREPC